MDREIREFREFREIREFREFREIREFREFREIREIRDYGDFSLTHTKRILILWWHSPDGFAYPRLPKYYPFGVAETRCTTTW